MESSARVGLQLWLGGGSGSSSGCVPQNGLIFFFSLFNFFVFIFLIMELLWAFEFQLRMCK